MNQLKQVFYARSESHNEQYKSCNKFETVLNILKNYVSINYNKIFISCLYVINLIYIFINLFKKIEDKYDEW